MRWTRRVSEQPAVVGNPAKPTARHEDSNYRTLYNKAKGFECWICFKTDVLQEASNHRVLQNIATIERRYQRS